MDAEKTRLAAVCALYLHQLTRSLCVVIADNDNVILAELEYTPTNKYANRVCFRMCVSPFALLSTRACVFF